MSTLVTEPTAQAHWQRLVQDAAATCHSGLDHELEAYLVQLLMRFSRQPGLADRVLALEYLQAMLASGQLRHEQLRQVGDQCLLYSGLFPRRARRRRVAVRYYVDLGRSAYQQVAASAQRAWALTYRRLSEGFVGLMDVLQAMRGLDAAGPAEGDLLELYELWRDCGSRRARRLLQTRCPAAAPVAVPDPAGRRRH